MRLIDRLVFLALILLCLELKPVNARRNSKRNDESQDKNQSLLDVISSDAVGDEALSSSSEKRTGDTDTDSSENSTSSKPSSKKKNSAKTKSRQIRLPEDYNKLQVPKPNQLAIMKTLLKLDSAELDSAVIDELARGVDDDDDDDEDMALVVDIDVNIRNIRDIDEIDEKITMELDFIVQWTDQVILYENQDIDFMEILGKDVETQEKILAAEIMSLDPSFLNKIWKPDIFIENAVSITRPELISKPVRLLFSKTGKVVFSTRVAVKLDCEMEFHYYPADTQFCVVKLRSYSYTTADLEIQWDEPGALLLMDRGQNNFDVKVDMLSSHTLIEAKGLIYTNYSEKYNVLQFQIASRRKLSYHLIQTYLPSTFFIMITWLSFLLPTTMVEARIGISMTTLLTLTAMFSSVRESSPIVSYVKAIDIWMLVCIIFVFLTLLEFTVLTWHSHLQESGQGSLDGVHVNNKELSDIIETDKIDDIAIKQPKRKKAPSKMENYIRALKEDDIEKYGFNAFLVLFLIFNLIYWPWLLISAKYFEWEVDYRYNVKDES